MKTHRPVWFRAKQYGWGWTPATWQGWTVLGVWAVVFVTSIVGLQLALGDTVAAVVWSLVIGLLETGVLLVITYRTGEPPAWHWGSPKNTK